MERRIEIRQLLFCILVVSLGFLLLNESWMDRGIPPLLITKGVTLDISPYFLDFFPNALYGIFFALIFFLIHFFLRLKLPKADPFILPAVALLSGIGVIMALRLAPDLATARNDALQALLKRNPGIHANDNVLTLAQLGLKQFTSLIVGVLGLISATYFKRHFFSRLSSKKYVWVFLSALLVIGTLLFGSKINERRLWLFGFQTVELTKLLMILFMAGYIYERGKGIAVYSKGDIRSWFQYAAPFAVMCFFGLIPIVIQRDFGPTVLLFAVFLIIFHYAGNRKVVTALFIILIAAISYISYKAGIPSVVRERFDIMLDPFRMSENMSRVLWSISSGGVSGSGIGYGQPYRIPEVQSDFTFAAICEELGFAGATGVILAYAVLISRCLKIASVVTNIYKKTLVTGIAALITVQSFMIICGNLGGIPMTGITLPLVSYGGSSLLVNFFMIGIVLRISGEGER